MSTNALPEGFEVKSRKEWEEILKSADTSKRGMASNALRLLGHKPAEYVKMKEDVKLGHLLKAQEEAGYDENGQLAGKASTKATTTTTKATTTTTKAAAGSSSSSSGGGGAGSGDIDALRKQISDVQAQLVDLSKVVIDMQHFVKEVHLIARVGLLTDEASAQNLEDEGVRNEMFGERLISGNE